MANVRVQWSLPTTRESGRALDPTDIRHVRIEISADGGANFGLIGDFTPDVLETLVQDLDFGTWTFRGLVADTKGRVSQPVVRSVEIADNSPPGPFDLTLELV